MNKRFANKRVIVGGGGGQIGRSVGKEFAREGAAVLLLDMAEEALAEVKADFESEGLTVETGVVSISDNEAVAEVASRFIGKHGGVDTVVSLAAGFYRESAHLADVDKFLAAISVDLVGLLALVKAAVPSMVRQGEGSIVAVSSMQAIAALPGRFAYSVSKGGVSSAVRQLAVDYGPFGIRANAVLPGAIMHPANLARNRAEMTDEQFEKLIETYPLRRFGTSEDVAKLVLFLASDDASWITGQNILVDGGATVQLAEVVVHPGYQQFLDRTSQLQGVEEEADR